MKTIVPDPWEIPPRIRDRFGDSAGQQRAMYADGHLLLVLHEPPDADDRERKACLLWRSPGGTWAWTKDGDVTHLLKKHLSRFADRADRLETELHAATCASDYFRLLQEIAPLHRTARNLHATLQQAREFVPDDRDIIVARDKASDIERCAELLHADAKNGLDYTVAEKTELQSQRSYEMAVSAHRLNVLAALFFPISAISSIFSMNFNLGPESIGTSFFWTVLGAGCLCGIFLASVIARKPVPPVQ